MVIISSPIREKALWVPMACINVNAMAAYRIEEKRSRIVWIARQSPEQSMSTKTYETSARRGSYVVIDAYVSQE